MPHPLPAHLLPGSVPPRLYTREVLDLAGVSQATWNKMRSQGKAPQPVYRGKGGLVYQTLDIYRFLGFIDEKTERTDYDPIMQGIEKIGRTKNKAAPILHS